MQTADRGLLVVKAALPQYLPCRVSTLTPFPTHHHVHTVGSLNRPVLAAHAMQAAQLHVSPHTPHTTHPLFAKHVPTWSVGSPAPTFFMHNMSIVPPSSAMPTDQVLWPSPTEPSYAQEQGQEVAVEGGWGSLKNPAAASEPIAGRQWWLTNHMLTVWKLYAAGRLPLGKP